jgi:hypothetical protein
MGKRNRKPLSPSRPLRADWNRAQDLSLLVDLKYEDLQKLQAVGAKAQAENAKYILRNDFSEVWEHVKRQRDARVDIVLDNGGFEWLRLGWGAYSVSARIAGFEVGN